MERWMSGQRVVVQGQLGIRLRACAAGILIRGPRAEVRAGGHPLQSGIETKRSVCVEEAGTVDP
eukprot:8584629-Pyramimonas_sp.AAC.1